jgi:cell fate (sporulation/competence/biofilm development) regulator YlbF (YheA/YmcA/DUF963 family)
MLEQVKSSLDLWERRIKKFEGLKQVRITKESLDSKNVLTLQSKIENYIKIRDALTEKFGNMSQQEFDTLKTTSIKDFNYKIKALKAENIDKEMFEYMMAEAELQVYFGDIPRI